MDCPTSPYTDSLSFYYYEGNATFDLNLTPKENFENNQKVNKIVNNAVNNVCSK